MLIAIALLCCFMLSSCAVLYKSTYYVPDNSTNFKFVDNIKKYSHPRNFTSIHTQIIGGDSIQTWVAISTGITRNYSKVLSYGFILPIIPRLSFTKRHEKEYSQTLVVSIHCKNSEKILPIDVNNIEFILNGTDLIKPNEIHYGITDCYSKEYTFVFDIENYIVQNKIKNINIKTKQSNLFWLNETTFLRQNKITYFVAESLN